MPGLIDESAPESARGIHYVIGSAVLLEPSRRDDVRESLRKLVVGRRRPFQTRARRRSLVQLVEMLAREGVDEVMIESRGPQDAQDRQTLIDAAHRGLCPEDLVYSFGGKEDPLLWLPDAVAGLLSEAECRKSARWVAELQRTAHIFEVRRLDV